MMSESLDENRIWDMINATLGELTLTPDARILIENLITDGIKRVQDDPSQGERAEEARHNFGLLAEYLKKAVVGATTSINVTDVNRVLDELCPLYPICEK